jgi:small subunit ribosomal protein S9
MSRVFRGSRKEALASFVPAALGADGTPVPGGVLLINGQAPEEYFSPAIFGGILGIVRELEQEFSRNFEIAGRIRVHGGGKSGQAASVKLAIHRYIAEHYPETKPKLRSLGELTFDTRKKAVYKLGKARKSPQRNKR